eukprot:Nk52_evm24s621 gene=Nk52_evmTU24s621
MLSSNNMKFLGLAVLILGLISMINAAPANSQDQFEIQTVTDEALFRSLSEYDVDQCTKKDRKCAIQHTGQPIVGTGYYIDLGFVAGSSNRGFKFPYGDMCKDVSTLTEVKGKYITCMSPQQGEEGVDHQCRCFQYMGKM